ncbi:hypothetical protein NIES22_57660 [Calothrix brevissima NIES-22]|nr:hypothetical protein NIES22_57660 [Calothrix brevissima NIES-22]
MSIADQEFIKESTQANREDVTSLQSASQKFNNPGVQNFVSQFLPVQQQHLQIATALNNGDRTNSSRTPIQYSES